MQSRREVLVELFSGSSESFPGFWSKIFYLFGKLFSGLCDLHKQTMIHRRGIGTLTDKFEYKKVKEVNCLAASYHMASPQQSSIQSFLECVLEHKNHSLDIRLKLLWNSYTRKDRDFKR